jgi:hypothetical protein
MEVRVPGDKEPLIYTTTLPRDGIVREKAWGLLFSIQWSKMLNQLKSNSTRQEGILTSDLPCAIVCANVRLVMRCITRLGKMEASKWLKAV